jgi:POTRA domain-containing FtsQ-type protein
VTLPVRVIGFRRARRRSVSRASTVFTRARLVAAGMLLVTTAALHQLTTSPVFALDPTTVTIAGLRYTDADAARDSLGLGGDQRLNLFRLRTSDLERSLSSLPTISRAEVRVVLPDAMYVSVVEREPILGWRSGDRVLLVDVSGTVLAIASTADIAMPVIEDRRANAPQLEVGSTLAALDLEVARLLGAVGPEQVGSTAPSVSLVVEEADGWVLEVADGWRAVFGHYTVAARPPSTTIPEQVACLRGLLADRESRIESVTLALSTDACGTFRERGEPTASPRPSGRP